MAEFRFDGRVVVITGAGRGLGLGYARLLAARGASVVVNDLGGNGHGGGADASIAEAVARELRLDGGQAVASPDSVGTEAGAAAIVDTALQAFGRLDAVINNAGILAGSTFPEVSAGELQRHLDVHVLGSFNVTRAAWPHLQASGAGRVLMTLSAAIYGAAPVLAYATSKGALLGMTGALAQAGAEVGIRVNAISPRAGTRLTGNPNIRRAAGVAPASGSGVESRRSADRAAPVAAYLVHERCTASGRLVAADAGRAARIFLGETRGYMADELTVEDVAEHWDEIDSIEVFEVPGSAAEQRRFADALLAAR
jgi:NAD(P)-dependent dehydrogenase (short-subunit alcohol dehydrogenase family)